MGAPETKRAEPRRRGEPPPRRAIGYQSRIALGNPNSPRFTEVARLTGVSLEQVALAIAGELRPVAAERTRTRLDLIAAELGDLSHLPPATRANALVVHLEERMGLRSRLDRSPDALMLDRVVEHRAGHPYALAIVHAAVGLRCGLEMFPVLAGSALLVGDRGADHTVLIDPVPGGRPPRANPAWVCPHVVARLLLGAIGERYEERGDIVRAIRTAELAELLPLHGARRADDEAVLRGLRAKLN